ncbi:thioredoxin family protein [Prevotella sp. KH2C16]|uniref:DUF255 domain-containing protein n=1 Tax=Prevotella sp. KH2C16 TaxID=1855325 RepID=UPI0008E0DF42|nr:thioredoxin family protein [Prevotella sp. KH2C16]SFG62469.1 Thioredoxin-like [Prevotella sp. KH2C16]
MKKAAFTLLLALTTIMASAQGTLKKVYDETINPMEQIDRAIEDIRATGANKFIVCQIGGNWCPWCLLFADFVSRDTDIMKVINDNYLYLHVNYNPRKGNAENATALMKRLGSPQRFGFPVFVILDGNGKVLHIQDSSFLEEGKGYDKEKVLRFLKAWTPEAVRN